MWKKKKKRKCDFDFVERDPAIFQNETNNNRSLIMICASARIPIKIIPFFFLFFSRSNNFSSLSLSLSSVSLFRGNIEREFQILPLIRASILSRVGGMIWPGTSERSRSPGMEMNDEPYPGVSKAGFRWHLLRDNGTPVESPTKPLIGGEEKKVAGIVQER